MARMDLAPQHGDDARIEDRRGMTGRHVVTAIGAHHERLDGSGYPRQTAGGTHSRLALRYAYPPCREGEVCGLPLRPALGNANGGADFRRAHLR